VPNVWTGVLENLGTERARKSRKVYEDQNARMPIMAGADAHGPDTLLQTVQANSLIPLAVRGRAIHSERTGRNLRFETALRQNELKHRSMMNAG
jgi:hypothetical protein